ncbi:MAG: hypothetical protein ABIQ38_07090 [Ilumatobacteraceae bacterium]
MFAPIAVISIIQSVALVALFLIAIGLGLVVLTWWFWTSARPEPISLAPLEIMSERRYFRASEEDRKEMISSARKLVNGSKSPRPTQRTTQRTTGHSTSDPISSKPVDPLLK